MEKFKISQDVEVEVEVKVEVEAKTFYIFAEGRSIKKMRNKKQRVQDSGYNQNIGKGSR